MSSFVDSPMISFSLTFGSKYSCQLNEVKSPIPFPGIGLDPECYDDYIDFGELEYEKGDTTLLIFSVEIESDPEVIEAIYENLQRDDKTGYCNTFSDLLREISLMRRDYVSITSNYSAWNTDNPYIAYFFNRSFTFSFGSSPRAIHLGDGKDCVYFNIGRYICGKFRSIKGMPLTLDILVSEITKSGLIHPIEFSENLSNPEMDMEGLEPFYLDKVKDSENILDSILISLNRYIEGQKPKKSARK